MAAHPERWYFTRESLQNTPSRKCGVEPEKELSYRQQSANLIQDMGQRLQVNQLCINTAIVYMHRFYMFQPFTRFPRNSISAACLFLAAKVEEQPHKLEHVLKVAHLCLHRGGPPLDTKSDAYMQQTQELVINESIILQTFAFDVAVSHPHTHVVKCTQMIRASKDLAQTSYFMATNSLHLTTFCLQYKPTIVACVCVHLACKWSLYEIPKSSDGNYWWEYVDPNVNKELLDQLTMEFLQIIEACPNRLKRRIALHKQQVMNSKQANKEVGTEDTDGTEAGRPGSQSSLDFGVGDNDDSHKLLALPPHMSSPWLSKQSKDEQKNSGDFGKPGQSSKVPDKVDLIEPSQPAKKSLEEYRQQKEKERKLQEQKQEKMKLEKMKQEKRRYEAAQRVAHDTKSRPKIPPPPLPGHRKPDHLHHPSANRHPAERSGEHPSKVKSTTHTDPHMRQAQEHHLSSTHQSDRDKRHRPPPPNMVEGSHVSKPSHSHKRPHPVPPHQHPKDSRHHMQHKDQTRGSVPMKPERTDEKKSLDDKHHASGSHKPHHTDSRKPIDTTVVHKSHGKREAPIPKAETPSLLQKAQLIKEKTQAQKDEEQRINDDLSDIRDEIMRDLEQETIGDPVTLTRVEAVPAVVERKRNSLDNLRQVAVEELMHMKKSDAESGKPHPTISGSVSESKVARETSHNEVKPSVKLKGEGKGGHNFSHGTSQPTPSKKLKSPMKVKGEPHKTSKRSPNLGTLKNDSPLAKKKVLDLTSHSSKHLGEVQHKQSDTTLPQTIKVEKSNIVLEQPHSEYKSKNSETSQPQSFKTDRVTIKCNEQEQIKNVASAKSKLVKEESTAHTEVDKSTKVSDGTGPVNKSEVKTESDGNASTSQRKISIDLHPSFKDTVQGIKPLSPPSPPTIHEARDEQVPLPSKGIALNKVQDLKETAESLPGVRQQSPKQKHRHKDKKKHKKHRQEKQLESSGSPNLETTSILTKSGGIKLKIKGLSSSFAGSSPSDPSKSNQEPNSGREKDHRQRHKHGKTKSHNRKRSLSPSGETSPPKKKSTTDGSVWNNSPQSGLPESQSLLSLPMPPPDPKKVSPSKHSTSRRNRQPPPPPPPPPPLPRSPEDSPPPPPPPPQPMRGNSSPLTTVTALPSMDAMPMDPYTYSNQYLMYPGMGNVGMQPGNGSISHQNSSSSRHGGHKPPPYM